MLNISSIRSFEERSSIMTESPSILGRTERNQWEDHGHGDPFVFLFLCSFFVVVEMFDVSVLVGYLGIPRRVISFWKVFLASSVYVYLPAHFNPVTANLRLRRERTSNCQFILNLAAFPWSQLKIFSSAHWISFVFEGLVKVNTHFPLLIMESEHSSEGFRCSPYPFHPRIQ